MYQEVKHYLVDYADRCEQESAHLADKDARHAEELLAQAAQANSLCNSFQTGRVPLIGATRTLIEKRVAELEAEFKAAACTIEEIDQSEVASAVGDSMTKGMELQTAKKCLLQLQARQ